MEIQGAGNSPQCDSNRKQFVQSMLEVKEQDSPVPTARFFLFVCVFCFLLVFNIATYFCS